MSQNLTNQIQILTAIVVVLLTALVGTVGWNSTRISEVVERVASNQVKIEHTSEVENKQDTLLKELIKSDIEFGLRIEKHALEIKHLKERI